MLYTYNQNGNIKLSVVDLEKNHTIVDNKEYTEEELYHFINHFREAFKALIEHHPERNQVFTFCRSATPTRRRRRDCNAEVTLLNNNNQNTSNLDTVMDRTTLRRYPRAEVSREAYTKIVSYFLRAIRQSDPLR